MEHPMLRCTVALVLFWMIIALTGCGGMKSIGGEEGSGVLEPISWPRPAFLQAEKKQTAPGLSVIYSSNKIRHISEMPSRKWMVKKGSPGEPIQVIAHQFGNGEVFGSGKSREVCVQMQGYLNFKETGIYLIKANSNDGIRVFLDNKRILNDPDVHAARFTPDAEIEIKQPGRYTILVRYFQRKGKATLEMYWKTPGTDRFDIIPAMAYSHDSHGS
jgi:hypothetical protein